MSDILQIFLGAAAMLLYHIYRDWKEDRRMQTIIAGLKSETAYEFKTATQARKKPKVVETRINTSQDKFQ